MAVALPLSSPVTVVERVNAGVAPPLEVPARPLAETTDTAVTEPEPLLLNVVQSVEVKYPLTDVVAAGMLIAGVVPPLETTGDVAETLVTVPTLTEPPNAVADPFIVIVELAS